MLVPVLTKPFIPRIGLQRCFDPKLPLHCWCVGNQYNLVEHHQNTREAFDPQLYYSGKNRQNLVILYFFLGFIFLVLEIR